MIKKRTKWYKELSFYQSIYVDETYIKIKGTWKYLYRAINKSRQTIDFYLSHTRNTKAAKRFLNKVLKDYKYDISNTIHSDQNPAYGKAIQQLKSDHSRYSPIHHRQIKYLNNRLEVTMVN